MKQTICAIMLVFSTVLVFSQTRVDTFVYVMEVFSGAAEERGPIRQNLKLGVRSRGFSVTESIREADYLVNGSVKGDFLPLLVITLLNSKQEELDSRDLMFSRPQEAYDRFPETLEDLFEGQPLRQRPVSAAPVIGTAAAGQKPAAANQGPANEAGAPSDQGPAESEDTSPEGWKYKWLFLNARAGVSNRFYRAGSDSDTPTTVSFTFDAGVEGELHFFNFLALQSGLNYALDQRTTSPVTLPTYVLSIPLMAKFIFSPGKRTTLGFYEGVYGNIRLVGPAKPPPFGVLAGMDVGIKAGPGAVLFDIRFSKDLGDTGVDDDTGGSYDRMFLTLSVGYKYGFIAKKH